MYKTCRYLETYCNTVIRNVYTHNNMFQEYARKIKTYLGYMHEVILKRKKKYVKIPIRFVMFVY